MGGGAARSRSLPPHLITALPHSAQQRLRARKHNCVESPPWYGPNFLRQGALMCVCFGGRGVRQECETRTGSRVLALGDFHILTACKSVVTHTMQSVSSALRVGRCFAFGALGRQAGSGGLAQVPWMHPRQLGGCRLFQRQPVVDWQVCTLGQTAHRQHCGGQQRQLAGWRGAAAAAGAAARFSAPVSPRNRTAHKLFASASAVEWTQSIEPRAARQQWPRAAPQPGLLSRTDSGCTTYSRAWRAAMRRTGRCSWRASCSAACQARRHGTASWKS